MAVHQLAVHLKNGRQANETKKASPLEHRLPVHAPMGLTLPIRLFEA